MTRDAAVKATFRKKWPRATRLFLTRDPALRWVRCQPVISKNVTHPRLYSPGSNKFSTQPDGMYLLFSRKNEYADVISFEACNSIQNLYDKRSRYAPTTGSIMIDVRKEWLCSLYNKRLKWWNKICSFNAEPNVDFLLPVRYLRVCYILPNEKYRDWSLNHSPSGHEYYAPMSALSSVTAGAMRAFLEQMSPLSHFYSATKVRTNRAAKAMLED